METTRMDNETGEPKGLRGKTFVSRVGESAVLVMYGLIALEIVLALRGARAVRPPRSQARRAVG